MVPVNVRAYRPFPRRVYARRLGNDQNCSYRAVWVRSNSSGLRNDCDPHPERSPCRPGVLPGCTVSAARAAHADQSSCQKEPPGTVTCRRVPGPQGRSRLKQERLRRYGEVRSATFLVCELTKHAHGPKTSQVVQRPSQDHGRGGPSIG